MRKGHALKNNRGYGALRRAWGLGLALCWLAEAAAAQWDCSRATAPQRCELYRQGAMACNDLPVNGRHACMQFYTPALSCLRERDAKRCEALRAAHSSCDGLEGKARRVCVNERLPPPDCARSANPARCRARAEAELKCADREIAQRLCVRQALQPD
ncbi:MULTISPECIES: hypothetical protein [Chromobacterium]|uniref:Uncharacterized protein n=1 Tax=Chromobacterium haemolyticum TaxID=394935 RepID=A0A1W0CGN4_9NEIS|nr:MULTISPECIES: hypothetical protein [Chromobacterium]OQS33841.1 hypothetical protein B0T45_19870 [Chromobacterium haemolyticum]QOZ82136.1 hypothetical protein DXT74_03090 [Chromobacterium sp. Rain0013]WON82152.1 hypothetical protein OK026_13415 [Chromobacterium haemolyticum]